MSPLPLSKFSKMGDKAGPTSNEGPLKGVEFIKGQAGTGLKSNLFPFPLVFN